MGDKLLNKSAPSDRLRVMSCKRPSIQRQPTASSTIVFTA
jgi:hypothetical protein